MYLIYSFRIWSEPGAFDFSKFVYAFYDFIFCYRLLSVWSSSFRLIKLSKLFL